MRLNVKEDLFGLFSQYNVKMAPEYERALRLIAEKGFSYSSPAMLGVIETVFENKLMIAHNMLQNAVDEAKGAARVDIIAQRYATSGLLEKMKRHAADELRHSKMFAGAIRLMGYQIESELPESTQQNVEGVLEFDDDLMTFLCRVHSIEVRSWTLLRLYIENLGNQDDDSLRAIVPILDEIMSDEIYHVVYTGAQIIRWLEERQLECSATLMSCFEHTNRETWADMTQMVRYLAEHYDVIHHRPVVRTNQANLH